MSSDSSGQPEARTTRTALDVLDRDHDRLLYAGDDARDPEIVPLVDGFEDRGELLAWYQAAAVRTLGHIDRVLTPDLLLGSSALNDALVHGGDDSRTKVYLRQRLTERLNTVCDVAYKDLRSRAKERVPKDSGGEESETPYDRIDPDRELHPMQRPAFTALDDAQKAVLSSLLQGFDDRRAVSRWARGVKAACNGEQPAQLMDHIVSERVLLDALQGEFRGPEASRAVRQRFAVTALFPAFLRAARTLRGSERARAREAENPWNEVK